MITDNENAVPDRSYAWRSRRANYIIPNLFPNFLGFILQCLTQNYDPQEKIRPCEPHKSHFMFEYHLYQISYKVGEKL